MADVPMVQAADFGQVDDLTRAWRLDCPWLGRVLAQRQMGSRPMVVGEVGLQDPVQMTFAEDDDVVEALSPEEAEAGPMPADHGVGLDDDEDVRPARPEPGKDEPERGSLLRRRGRPEVRRRLANCWRRARFSSARSAWVRKAERSAPRRLRNRSNIVR